MDQVADDVLIISGVPLAPCCSVTPTRGDPCRVPIATYRMQFNSGFRFSDALPVVDYVAALGISDAYASSYLRAVPGSAHGYDVADPTQLNPEIGSEAE